MSHKDYPIILDEDGWESIHFLVRTKQITDEQFLDVVRSQAAALVYAP